MPKHILIVDDEHHFRFASAVFLRSAGYKVTEAADGHEALKMLLESRGEKIDLLIVDVQVPRMSGIELICELKRNGIFIPTLIISGFFNKALLTGLAESGCNEFLGKPFEPRDMLDRISNILDKFPDE